MTRKEKLTDRTVKIIKKGGTIFVKKDKWYLGHWTNVAAGPDKADWVGKSRLALEIFNLEWAFAIAKLYGGKVVVNYTRPAKPQIIYESDIQVSAISGGDTSYNRR